MSCKYSFVLIEIFIFFLVVCCQYNMPIFSIKHINYNTGSVHEIAYVFGGQFKKGMINF
jgi:hypothetical protein